MDDFLFARKIEKQQAASPVIAAAFGYLVFNEVPSTNLIYGGILLLASGFWLTWDMQNRENKSETPG